MASYTNHESYAHNTNNDNDITVIMLTQAVDLNTYTPACLAKTSDTATFDGKNALVYGEIILISGQSDSNEGYTRLGHHLVWRNFL